MPRNPGEIDHEHVLHLCVYIPRGGVGSRRGVSLPALSRPGRTP